MSNVSLVNSNFFAKASENTVPMSLGASIAPNASTIPLNGGTNYSDGDIVVLTINPTSATGSQVVTGQMSNGAITNAIWTRGSNSQHSAGETVVDNVSATHWNMLIKGMLVGRNQDGTLKSGSVGSLNLQSNSVQPVHIADGSLPATKIDDTTRPAGTLYWTNLSGQVIPATTDARIQYDSFTTNNHAGITNPTPGVLQVSVAGYYSITANANASDGTFPQATQCAPVGISIDGGNQFYRVTPFASVTLPFAGSGPATSATVIYLAANTQIHHIWSNRSGNAIRTAPQAAGERLSCSMSIVKVA